MIDASTIEDIKRKILKKENKYYIALILFCRYRKDESSLPWRVAVNSINYHFSSGRELDIYVPGFSFYDKSKREDIGTAIKLENSDPLGFYYPEILVESENFLRKEMTGFHLGSSVAAVAIEIENGVPDWKNGAVMNLSNRSAEDVERQIMAIIDGCKKYQGRIDPSTAKFRRNFRLNSLVEFLMKQGWNAASAFSGIGALILT